MTGRMRPLRYGTIALCVIAQCAFSTPSRVLESPAPLAITYESRMTPFAAGYELGDQRAVHDRLVALFPLDAAPLRVGVRRTGDTRVAEPSTLLLLSFGLFGLIAWSRRRR